MGRTLVHVVDALAWCAMLAVAAWPRRDMHPLLMAYGFDVVAPFCIYGALRLVLSRVATWTLASGLYALFAAAEISQLFDLSALGVPAGVFDVVDLAAYAAGTAAGVAWRATLGKLPEPAPS